MEMSHLKYFVLFKTIAVEKVAITAWNDYFAITQPPGGLSNTAGVGSASQKMQLKIHQNIFIQLLFCVST